MKTLGLASLATAALMVPVFGADLVPIYQAPQPPPGVLWSWTGLYLGANSGWIASAAAGDIRNAGADTGTLGLGTFLVSGNIPQIVNLDLSGFIGGGQIGYNLQLNQNWVVGIEADFGGEAGGSDTVPTVAPPGIPISTVFNRELNTLGTVRGRLGFAIVPDQLWYVTAGGAYGETKLGTTFMCGNCNPSPAAQSGTSVQTSKTSIGWTIGSGIEWKFLPAWSLKVEYLYVDLGSFSNVITYAYAKNVSTLISTGNERDNVVRVGINYKFSDFLTGK
jgi:outer membrane immunogenic protein